MPPTIPLVTAAAVANQIEATVHSWRNRLPMLAALGERRGPKNIQVSLAETVILALVGRHQDQNRALPESTASTFAYAEVVDAVVEGKVPENATVFLIEVTYPGGKTKRFSALGGEWLGKVMADAINAQATAIQVLDLSQLCDEVKLGWLCATEGREAARSQLLTKLAAQSPEEREAALAAFNQIADRVAPKPTRPPKAYVLEAEPVPVPLPPEGFELPATPAKPVKVPQ